MGAPLRRHGRTAVRRYEIRAFALRPYRSPFLIFVDEPIRGLIESNPMKPIFIFVLAALLSVPLVARAAETVTGEIVAIEGSSFTLKEDETGEILRLIYDRKTRISGPFEEGARAAVGVSDDYAESVTVTKEARRRVKPGKQITGEVVKLKAPYLTVYDADTQKLHRLHFDKRTQVVGALKPGAGVEAAVDGDHAVSITVTDPDGPDEDFGEILTGVVVRMEKTVLVVRNERDSDEVRLKFDPATMVLGNLTEDTRVEIVTRDNRAVSVLVIPPPK